MTPKVHQLIGGTLAPQEEIKFLSSYLKFETSFQSLKVSLILFTLGFQPNRLNCLKPSEAGVRAAGQEDRSCVLLAPISQQF